MSEYGENGTKKSDSTSDNVENNDDNSNPTKKDSGLGECYHYDKDGVTLIYTDPTSKQEYILNADNSDWIPRNQSEGRMQTVINYNRISDLIFMTFRH